MKVRLMVLLAVVVFLILGSYLYFTFTRPFKITQSPMPSFSVEEEGKAMPPGEWKRLDVFTEEGLAPETPEPVATTPVMRMSASASPAIGALTGGGKVDLTRKLIREAHLALMVQDVPKGVQQVRQVAGQLDGYVASVSQSRGRDGTWSATLTLRIPSERYSEALSRLQGLGQVDNLQESVQDVTEEFVDLEARLRNLKRSERHLLELLQRTGKVSDLLQVERELSQRRLEIERIEGRLRYLTHQTTFSTILVTLREFRARPMPETAFSIPKVFADAFRTVVVVLRVFLVIAIWVLVFGIIWVPISSAAWLLVRKGRRPKEGVTTGGSE